MGMIASQITSLTIVYSTVYSDPDQRKHRNSESPVTGEFPAQMASNAENVSIWWRHYVFRYHVYTQPKVQTNSIDSHPKRRYLHIDS